MSLLSKLDKVDDSLTVNRYTNGWMVELGGRNEDDEWDRVKIICPDLVTVTSLLEEYSQKPIG